MLTNITEEEKKRFTKFQEHGMLPSVALNRIKLERDSPEIKKEYSIESDYFSNDKLFYFTLGGISIMIIYILLKNRTTISQPTLKLNNIPGIDINSLYICKQKGLI